MTGFGTSVIGCGAECGIDYEVAPEATPDGRPGVRVLVFGFAPKYGRADQLKNRVGQCVLTSPGSACFNGLDSAQRICLVGWPAILRRRLANCTQAGRCTLLAGAGHGW